MVIQSLGFKFRVLGARFGFRTGTLMQLVVICLGFRVDFEALTKVGIMVPSRVPLRQLLSI